MTSERNFLKVITRVTANEEHSEVSVKTDLAQTYWETAFIAKKTHSRGRLKAVGSGADFENNET